jgi:hypothetical protein
MTPEYSDAVEWLGTIGGAVLGGLFCAAVALMIAAVLLI